MLGAVDSTDATAALVSADGERLTLEISAVPFRNGERIVGVFGMLVGPLQTEHPPPPAHLTPRQAEMLRLLEQGRSTKQIAAELHLSTDTVRNHIRRLLQALGVSSRLEAVAVSRGASISQS